MAQKPLSDGYTGKAPTVAARLVPSDLEDLDRVRQARGQTRAQFIRYAVRLAVASEAQSAAVA